MKVAIVHDYLTQRGGAERVVLSLSRLFPDAPIYTSLYDADDTYPEFAALDVRTSPLQRLPHRGPAFRRLLPLYPLAFDRLRLRGYDLVISSSSAFAHGVRVEGGTHVCYCYNPPRFLYQRERYLASGTIASAWARHVLPPLLDLVRTWDQAAARRPDGYIAISAAVADRIDRIYGRVAPVVHPPVDLPRAVGAPPEIGDPYVLVVSRLLDYKRVDLAVGAAAAVGVRLVVVGRGPEEARLRELASGDVEFRDGVSDAELGALLAGCSAVVQAGEEDFGLVPLEANAHGRPAVAFAASGALETVLDGVTGMLFREQTVESLAAALDATLRHEWEPAKARAHAACFGEARFHAELADVLSMFHAPPATLASR